MSITFKELSEKQQQINEAKRQYIQCIRGAAKEVLENYTGSLSLESKNWKAVNGQDYPYVYIDSGEPADLEVDLTSGCRFSIATVTEGTPRSCAKYLVPVEIYVENDELHIKVGEHSQYSKTFFPVDSKAKYAEISEAIKDCVMLQMNDVSFGRKSTPPITRWSQ
ncbi:hypothetical protein [Serratia liquefaciens]|uniref:hypothetical protein n=1 Tax=Serratia liquefaciens TaxID=614 RepID=UPI0018D7C356|nr:hypothetical protein [Serratia marcescens]